ncbi:glycosyltransferase [Photorhabdus laumondii]
MYQVYASVLIITRNRPERLEITLQSLVNQEATEAPFEVVIIDDGSDIDLRVITDKFVNHLAIQYIKTVHQGIAVARNIGIHTAKGEVIILTDDDVIVNSTFVRAHISEHRQGLEGFANVISEAMVAGIPVIAEKKGGIQNRLFMEKQVFCVLDINKQEIFVSFLFKMKFCV